MVVASWGCTYYSIVGKCYILVHSEGVRVGLVNVALGRDSEMQQNSVVGLPFNGCILRMQCVRASHLLYYMEFSVMNVGETCPVWVVVPKV